MPLDKQLGIFLETPDIAPEAGKASPPWRDDDIDRLRWAFILDLMTGVSSLKRTSASLFLPDRFTPPGDGPALPAHSRVEQSAGNTGERLGQGFNLLLKAEGSCAVVISAACPDLPVQFIKRAFLKLKHQDLVLGPAIDGGWYLLGLKTTIPELLNQPAGPGPVSLKDLLERARSLDLKTSLLFPWYRGDTVESLRFLNTMIAGRKIEKGRRFKNAEPALAGLIDRLHSE
jgi:glycosyltransferase A (GT-A) superfamily protein (DUF2064 family)